MKVWEIEYREMVRDPAIDGEQIGWRRLEHRPPWGPSVDVTIPGLDLGGEYEVRTRVVDDLTGAAGEWSRSSATVELPGTPPAAPYHVRMTCDDCLTWDSPVQALNQVGFVVRHTAGPQAVWELAEPAHAGVLAAPPLPLCAVPRGHRTYMVRAIDHDGQLSAPAIAATNRGAWDHSAEFVHREEDHRALSWPGESAGALEDAGDLVASPVPGGARKVRLSSLERVGSVAEHVPMRTGTSAAIRRERWGEGLPVRGRGAATAMWGNRYQPIEYVASFRVDAGEAEPEATLSLDLDVEAFAYRVEYRKLRGRARFWTGRPYELMGTGDPLAQLVFSRATRFQPWPGRLVGLRTGTYEVRLLTAPHWTQARVRRFAVRLSYPRREEIVSVTTPATATTRAAYVTPFRSLVHVEPVHVGSTPETIGRVHASQRTKGPVVAAETAGAAAAAALTVRVVGYGRR